MYNKLCNKIKNLHSNQSSSENIEIELLRRVQESSSLYNKKSNNNGDDNENENMDFEEYVDDDIDDRLSSFEGRVSRLKDKLESACSHMIAHIIHNFATSLALLFRCEIKALGNMNMPSPLRQT